MRPHPDEDRLGHLQRHLTRNGVELRFHRSALADLDLCSRCSRPADDLLDRAHGERICGACRELERERFEAAAGECVHGCGYALAFHQQPRSIADDCPTEDQARRRSGTA